VSVQSYKGGDGDDAAACPRIEPTTPDPPKEVPPIAVAPRLQVEIVTTG
jgi:hypothetical protein